MANPNAPHGASPVETTIGASWSSKCNVYHIPSADTNAYFIGDFVKSVATGSDAQGVADVTKAVASDQFMRGIIVGVLPVYVLGQQLSVGTPNLNILTIPATKTNDYYVLVLDDPNIVFEIQCNNTTALTPATTVGYNAKIVVANGVSPSPVSGTVVDSTNIATTSTFPLKIVGIAQRPNADFTAFTPLLCKFNSHELNVAATTGV